MRLSNTLFRRASFSRHHFGETTFANASGIRIADLPPDASRIISYALFFHNMTTDQKVLSSNGGCKSSARANRWAITN
jgi:hypothetical protein